MNAVIKKPTNLSLQADLLAEAKALAEIVKRKRAEQWLAENREAIAAYNRYVEEHGVFGEEYRPW